ncbi:MAG: hypothetical protein VYE77_05460 [Planctomycetota bacterium]|nr:hypothetical protein [Planctomycetota bacterium]
MRHAFTVVFLAVAFAQAQTCSQGQPTSLGTVTQLGIACNAGTLPQTTCTRLQVDCPGISSIEVRLRVTDPAPGLTRRGTVVLGTGGGGTLFYGERTGGPELITALASRGFRCIDRAWTRGWFDDPVSVRKQSCRYATLLQWIHQNLHGAGVFCATGTSGGSAELGYALTTWSSADILDTAVLTGGPPMSRLDKICGLDPSWNGNCQQHIQPGVFECGTPGCTLQPNHQVCIACSPLATATDLEADSILFPGATLSFPDTRVHVMRGGADCSNAVPAGLLFYHAVTSHRVLEIAKATPHWTSETVEGRASVLRAVLGTIACPGAAATLNAPTWPQLGGSLQVEVQGPASGNWLLALALTPDLVNVPGLGFLFLGPPSVIVGLGGLDPAGLGSFSMPVPATPSLTGLELFGQALTGSCLTNLLRVVVLP